MDVYSSALRSATEQWTYQRLLVSRADRLDLFLQLTQELISRAELGPKVVPANGCATRRVALLLPVRLLLSIGVAILIITAVLRLYGILILLRVRVAAARLGNHAVGRGV